MLFMLAVALLVLGIVLTWLRVRAQRESQAVVESVLDLTQYYALRQAADEASVYCDSGNNLHWRDES